MNLMDDQTIVLKAKHLTSSRQHLMQIILTTNFGSSHMFYQSQCREALCALIKSVKSARRFEFIASKLKTILDKARNSDSRFTLDDLTKDWHTGIDITKDFVMNLYTFFKQLQSKTALWVTSKAECQSIAAKILEDKRSIAFVAPDCVNVCSWCYGKGELETCRGSCNTVFHAECMNLKKRPKYNWDEISNGDATAAIPSACTNWMRSLRGRANADDHCNEHHSNNAVTECRTCKMAFDYDDEVMICVECYDAFHITADCIPAGSIVLSKTQLVCPETVMPKKRNRSPTCSVCHKYSSGMQQCQSCVGVFHKRCNPNQTHCKQCAANQIGDDIVYVNSTRKWRPAIIIANEQVPEKYTGEKSFVPGMVFVYHIGSHKYEQVHKTQLRSFRIDSGEHEALRKKINDASARNAVEIANALCKQPI